MKNKNTLLWAIRIFLGFTAAGALIVGPNLNIPHKAIALVCLIGFAVIQFMSLRGQKNEINRRAVAYGANSGITILLVLGLVGVANFLLQKHFWKWDLSRGKLNTLSDQTQKLMKGLKVPVKAVIFTKSQQEEKMKVGPLLDNYRSLNSKFEIEYVDPDKETARAAVAGIKDYHTLILQVGQRDSKIVDPTEEKITNALIKLTSDKAITVCAVTQHAEKSFLNIDGVGYSIVKKLLTDQAYEFKEVNFRAEGKVPETCSALVIAGPASGFFPSEVTALSEYLNQGGRVFFALDAGLKPPYDPAPELTTLLKDWGIRLPVAVVLDPHSKVNRLEATIPVTSTYSKENPITSEFQEVVVLPLLRPIEIFKDTPKGLKVQWLVQTTPDSWAKSNIASLSKDREIRFDEKSDIRGPMNAMVAINGKREGSNASRETRIVVIGSSLFASNQWGRLGKDNFDLFVNSISWLADDEKMISIRDREEERSLLQLNEVQGSLILYVTVILVPFGIAVTGIVVWWRRRKL